MDSIESVQDYLNYFARASYVVSLKEPAIEFWQQWKKFILDLNLQGHISVERNETRRLV